MPVQDVSFKQHLEALELSPEELQAIEHRRQVLAKLLAEKPNGKFKIEVLFGKARSTWKPFPGILTLWESGTKLHGGGDAILYMCPRATCRAVIPDYAHTQGFLVCSKCKSTWRPEVVHGDIRAVLPAKKWASVILRWYARLDHDADVYLKYSAEDLRTTAAIEQEKQKGGELLEGVRRKRTKGIYPLQNIIKDTNNGRSLLSLFEAFVLA